MENEEHINFKKSKFLQLSAPVNLYFNDRFSEGPFKFMDPNPNVNRERMMIGIRLQNINTSETYVFINFWAPHHITDHTNIKTFVEKILTQVKYQPGDRIIFAGDFNEYYENVNNIPIDLNVSGNPITLTLKQENVSCCGPMNRLRRNITRYTDLIDNPGDPTGLEEYLICYLIQKIIF